MKERIVQIMEREKLTPSRFAEMIGIQRSAVSHILSGRNNPSLDVLMKILETFTYIDSDWLIFGKGEMIKGTVPSQEPDLFSTMPINRPDVKAASEYRRETGLPRTENTPKNTAPEPVIYSERPSKSINKIMIFYSDNTYETFTLEKNKKE